MKYGAVFDQRDVSSVFRTDGDAVSPSVQSLSSPRVGTSVTANNKVMFELASPVIQPFGSHHAYSLYARLLNLACYRLGQSGDSDVVAHHKFFKFISLQ